MNIPCGQRLNRNYIKGLTITLFSTVVIRVQALASPNVREKRKWLLFIIYDFEQLNVHALQAHGQHNVNKTMAD